MVEDLIVDAAPPLFEVRIDRPKANALDAPASRRLGEVFARFRDDATLRVAIITGTGGQFFSAGWDLKAAAAGESYEADFGVGGFGGFPELAGLHKPVIAAVNGVAAGGGFEMVMAADLVVAADHVEFLLPEVSIGIIADSAAVRLARMIPPPIARELLLTGRRMGAEEALRWGLVNRVVPADRVLSTARDLAKTIAAAAPLAVEATLDVMRSTAHLSVEAALEALRSDQIETYRRMLDSEDAREGPRAFAEKRTPEWRRR